MTTLEMARNAGTLPQTSSSGSRRNHGLSISVNTDSGARNHCGVLLADACQRRRSSRVSVTNKAIITST